MKLRCLLGLLILPLVVGADGRKEDATKKDLKRLQGTWAFVLIEEEGVKKSQRELKGLEDRLNWTFTNHVLIRNLGMEFTKGKFKLDATKEPKEIDLFDYAAQGKTVWGIYTFQGEFLKISLGSPQSGERPTAFDTPPKSGRANFLMKRHVVQIKDS